MYDKFEVPTFIDLTPQDVYRLMLFQMIFWKRQEEKMSTLEALQFASLGDTEATKKANIETRNLIFGREDTPILQTERVKKIMEEESKKAYIVKPVAFPGLRMRRSR